MSENTKPTTNTNKLKVFEGEGGDYSDIHVKLAVQSGANGHFLLCEGKVSYIVTKRHLRLTRATFRMLTLSFQRFH